jgi:hypothetical protein
MPALLEKLVPKFNKELKKGAVLISHGFKIEKYKKKLYKTILGKSFNTYFYRV